MNKPSRLMNIELIEKVIKEASELGLKEVIPSTMGEPLLYPQFEQILILLQENNLKLNLTTNGTFPRRGPEKWAEMILPLASDVKISINGITKEIAESIMVGIKNEEHLKGIEKFIRKRDDLFPKNKNQPTITFQSTFLEENLMELPKILKYAISLGVNRFKGHHLWITWPQLEEQSLLRNTQSIIRWNKMVDTMHNIAEEARLPDGKKIILDNFYKISVNPSRVSPKKERICPFLGQEAWIAWDGTFNVCCAPDGLRKTLGTFGNVTHTSFLELWQSGKYTQLCENWGNYDVCRDCNMKKPMQDIKEKKLNGQS